MRAETATESPEARTIERALNESFQQLPLDWIRPSKTNPRTHFAESAIADLAQSLLDKGCIEPIVVRPVKGKPDAFEIVAGECRYRAAKLAKLGHLPAVIRDYTDEQALEIQLIENLHRNDLTALEQARGFRKLIDANPDKHSVQTIASRIGMSDSWVWDRMKLTDLIPEIAELLEQDRISVGHAIPIARLTPAQQRKVVAKDRGGLWTFDGALAFDEDPKTAQRVKPVSVRELQAWIADHIRFDVEHAAKAAPLQFGDVAERVAAAAAEPGRGKKVVPITFSHYCPDGAKDEHERTYGSTAWKKAEGQDGQPTCEYAVLGVVAAGEHYGEAFHVCIARDKCTLHWKREIAEREKNQKLRESGRGAQAAAREKKQAETQAQKWAREDAARKEREKAWGAIAPYVIAAAVDQVKTLKALTPGQAKALLNDDSPLHEPTLKKFLGAGWFKNPAAALLVTAVGWFHFSSYQKETGFEQYVKEVARPYGLDVKRLEAVRDKHQPKSVQPAGLDKGKKSKAA